MNYAEYVTALAALMVVEEDDAEFLSILPSIIDYAEQRMYRELNLLSVKTQDTDSDLEIGIRTVTPATRFVVVEQVNLYSNAARVPLTRVSRDVLDALYGSPTTTGVPKFYAMLTDQTVAVGPWPDQIYDVEVVGTARPPKLSATNTSTGLSVYLPDIFLACSMIFASGYQKNFGSQADDPRQAMSWETQYGTLMGAATAEETRKKAMMPLPAPPSGD